MNERPPQRPGFLQKLSARTRLVLNVTVGVIVVVLLAAILIPRFGGPSKPSLPVYESAAGEVQVAYNGSNTFLKSELPVYKLRSLTPASELLPTFAQALELQASPLAKTLYLNQNSTVSLSQVPDTYQVFYTNEDNSSNEESEPVSKSQAEAYALAFLTKLGYNTNELKLNDTLTRYTRLSLGSEGLRDVGENETSTIVFYFERQLENIPVALSSSPITRLELWVTKKGVWKADLTTLSFTADKGSTTKLLPLEQVIKQLQRGYFYILGTLDAVPQEKDDLQVTGLNLTYATLEYRIDEGQGVIMPFVRFEGTATLKNKETVDIGLITPAIRTNE